MSIEKRDMIIGGGLLALLLVLYFAVKPGAIAAVQESFTPASDTSSNTGPPTYNMPPLLTLPPYNIGNAPNTSGSSSNANHDCSCSSNNACANHQNVVDFNAIANTWRGISDGSGVASLPAVATVALTPITIPPARQASIPPRHVYSDWYAEATGTQTRTLLGGGTMQLNSIRGGASDIPPGLSGRQTYFLYQQVNGNYLSTLDIHTLNSAVAAAYASPA